MEPDQALARKSGGLATACTRPNRLLAIACLLFGLAVTAGLVTHVSVRHVNPTPAALDSAYEGRLDCGTAWRTDPMLTDLDAAACQAAGAHRNRSLSVGFGAAGALFFLGALAMFAFRPKVASPSPLSLPAPP